MLVSKFKQIMLSFYGLIKRSTSIREHRQEIKMRFNFTKYSSYLETELLKTIATYAEENRSITDMLYLFLRQLRENKIIIPALSVLESIIWVAENSYKKGKFQNFSDS